MPQGAPSCFDLTAADLVRDLLPCHPPTQVKAYLEASVIDVGDPTRTTPAVPGAFSWASGLPTPTPPENAVAAVMSALALGVWSEISVILKLGVNGWAVAIDGAMWTTASATAEAATSDTTDGFPRLMIQPCHVNNEDEIRTIRREGTFPPA